MVLSPAHSLSICRGDEIWFRYLFRDLMQGLMCIMKRGTPEQIKYAVRCLKVCKSRGCKDLAVEIVEVKGIVSVSKHLND